jgi:CRP-like cAMP-binding protein
MRSYSPLRKKFRAGQIIFSENCDCDGMYIIESGKVRVFTTATTTGKGLVDVELCVLGQNSIFGEMAMIDEGVRSASVEAIEPTVCTVITKRTFERQLDRIPSWMVNMIRILVIRLRETNQRLREIIGTYSTPPADPGTIITIAENDRPVQDQPAGMQRNSMVRHYRNTIISELTKTVRAQRRMPAKNNKM